MKFWDRTRELKAMHDAIGRSQAVIEFSMDGRILTANENFLGAMGYSLSEVVGPARSASSTQEISSLVEETSDHIAALRINS